MSFVVILSMLFAPVAFPASPWTEQKSYPSQIWGKLQFGLTNTLLGWVDLFATPNKYSNEGKNVWAGVGQGLVNTLTNTIGGALQLVTFPIPADLPLPNGGVDIGGK